MSQRIIGVAAAVGFGMAAGLLTLWVLAPAPECVTLGVTAKTFTCPNRFGASLAMPTIWTAGAVVTAAAGWLAAAVVRRLGRAGL